MDIPFQAGPDFGSSFLVQISAQILVQPCVQIRDMSSIAHTRQKWWSATEGPPGMGKSGDQVPHHWTAIEPSEDLNDVLLGTPTCIGRKRRRWRKSMDGGAPQTGHLERLSCWEQVADH